MAQNLWSSPLPGAGPCKSPPLPVRLKCRFSHHHHHRELGRQYGCTVNAVEPGPTNTHGFNHAGPSFLQKIQPMLDATPMGSRMAEPSEIAYAIAFLCEKRSGWITGACIPVNGGFLMP